jgi:hypothetical protein
LSRPKSQYSSALTFVTLWDIMDTYSIIDLAHAIDQLNWIECYGKRHSDKGEQDEIVNEATRQEIISIIENCSQQCIDSNLHDTFERINVDCRHHLETGKMTIRELEGHAREIRHCMKRELFHRTFVLIPEDIASQVHKMRPRWNKLFSQFNRITPDVEDALDCFAFGKDTAAVFHFMRTVEWGLRAFCIHLGFRNIKSKIKSSGKVQLTPVEYHTWEIILNQLQSKVDKKIGKLRRGSAKQKAQELYYPLLEEVKAFKEAWRNHVAHNRQSYTSEDVLAVSSHVLRFMSALASAGIYQV